MWTIKKHQALILLSLVQLCLMCVVQGGYVPMGQEQFDNYDHEKADALRDALADNGNVNSQGSKEYSIRSSSQPNDSPLTVGQRCNEKNDDLECDASQNLFCPENDLGFGKSRCLPIGTKCLLNFAENVHETLDIDVDGYRDTILDIAQVSNQDIADAARNVQTLDEFQQTQTFVNILDAFRNNPPTGDLEKLRDATNKCTMEHHQERRAAGVSNTAVAEPTATAPTAQGTTTYMGFKLELSALFDISMSLFWALGNDIAEPTAFIRGSFGVEPGVGISLPGILGFAFTGTTSDILGDAIYVDAEASVAVVSFGMGLIINTNNGLVSLELLLGPAIGVGFLGIGYSVTGELDPNQMPTAAPSTPAPPPPPPTTVGVYSSCLDVYTSGQTSPGLYTLTKPSDGTTFTAYCDVTKEFDGVTDSGGWMLFFSYAHAGGDTAGRNVGTLPTNPTTGFSNINLQDLGYAASDIAELRFYCDSNGSGRTPNDGRIVHFSTSNSIIIDIADTADQTNNSPSAWQTFAPLIGHTGLTPGQTSYVTTAPTEGFFREPFGLVIPGDAYYWSADSLFSGNRYWLCDDDTDLAFSAAATTNHRIYVRNTA